MKSIITAAAISVTMPFAASAATMVTGDIAINGQLANPGSSSITDGVTNSGIVDFDQSVSTFVQDASGALDGAICTLQEIGDCSPSAVTLTDLDLGSLPGTFWEVAGFTLKVTEVLSVSVPGGGTSGTTFEIGGVGEISGNEFAVTQSMFSISADSSGQRIAFSSTATPVPVPAAGLLLLGGIGALGAMRRRKKATS